MENFELDYDSDDMSAGARLMRYNVSDDPRPDSPVQSDHEASTISSTQNKSAPSGEPTSRATGPDLTQESDDDDDDDATFRRNLNELRGDVLYDLAGRHSHRDMLEKIALFHPQANFGTKDLTWRLRNAIKSRSDRLKISKGVLRHALDTTREANGVALPTSRGRKRSEQQVGMSVDAKDDGITSEAEGDVQEEVPTKQYPLFHRHTQQPGLEPDVVSAEAVATDKLHDTPTTTKASSREAGTIPDSEDESC